MVRSMAWVPVGLTPSSISLNLELVSDMGTRTGTHSFRPQHGYPPGAAPIGRYFYYFQVSARHADVYAQWGEPLAQTEHNINRVMALAAEHGRHPRISLSTRPILAATDDAAWDRAYQILDQVRSAAPTAG
jgi:alkanesulfonate monooxygenase